MALPPNLKDRFNESFVELSDESVAVRTSTHGSGGLVDTGNSTSVALSDGAVFIGEWTERSGPEIIMAPASDQDFSWVIQFSPDGVNVDSTLSYTYDASAINPPRYLVLTRRYYRIVITNDSGADMTYLRFQVSVGDYSPLTSRLNATLASDADSIVSRSVVTGQDPNGVYVNESVSGIIDSGSTNTALTNSSTFDTGVMDLGTSLGYLYTEIASDVNGQLVGTWYDGPDINNNNVIRTFTLPYTAANDLSLTGTRRLSRYLRYVFTNNSGFDQSRFHFRTIISKDPATGQLLGVSQFVPPNVLAQLTRSVLTGLDVNGSYQNVKANEFGVLSTSDFLLDVSRGFYTGISLGEQFGRNPEINTAAAEDVWNGGGLYTGHSPTENQNLQTLSSSTSDVGALRASGTVSSGTTTTLTDLSATFVTSSVAVGDIVMLDTIGYHGYVSSVDSETQLSVYSWTDDETDFDEYSPSATDTYRIAYATSTGAAVVRWSKILDSSYNRVIPKYVILNGTTVVATTGNFYRLSRGRIVKAGSSGAAVGEVRCRQATTTENVFAVMPALTNATSIAADTVPAGMTRVLFKLHASMSRNSGLSGSANVWLMSRNQGGVFQARADETITSSFPYNQDVYIKIPEKTDIKWQVASVSGNNTICTAHYKFLDYDDGA